MPTVSFFSSPTLLDWRSSNWKSYLLAIIAGLTVTLSLAPFSLWPISIFSTALLVWLLIDTTPAQAFKRGWFYGLGLFGAGTSWVYVSINTYGYAPAPLAIFLTLVFCAGLGLFTAFTFYIYSRWIQPHTQNPTLAFAAVFVMGEWWRSWFLTGFPWLYLGYGHLATPLAGWAPVGGVFTISFIIAYSAAIIAYSINQQKILKSHIYLCTTLWIVGAGLNYVEWTKPSKEPISVAMVQANISQHVKWSPEQYRPTLDLYRDTSSTLWPDYDLVVWPEAAIPSYYQNARGFLRNIDSIAKQQNSSLITGIPYFNREQEKAHNSIMAFGNGSGIYHKQRLVPFGEYVPMEGLLRGLIQFFDLPMSAFSSGDEKQAALLANNTIIAPFICYEIVYPELVTNWLPDAELLLTISNDAWFGHSIGPLQHLEMAQMRALEGGRFLIRATGSGISAIINPRGEIISQSEQFKQQVLTGTVTPMQGATPFSLTGSWPILLLSILLCVAGSIAARMRA